ARAQVARTAAADRTPTPLPNGDRPSPELRHAMFEAVGVVRDGATLAPLVARLQDTAAAAMRSTGTAPGTPGAFDAVPTATLAALAIAWSALRREESRGAHTRADFPDPAAPAHQTLTLDDLLLVDVLA
ncbi:MAG: hypothetical protein LPK92_05010, partial [Actinomycetes bacterium]|nr:hypothetical protein [Actinomycetes bacterium]